MKQFITILTLLFLAACGTEAELEDEVSYPYRDGTWIVESATEAKWTGITANKTMNTSAAEVDTLIIEQPGDHDLELTGGIQFTESAIQFMIRDYTIQNREVMGALSHVDLPSDYFPTDPNTESNHSGLDASYYTGSDGNEYLEINFMLDVNCNGTDHGDVFLTLFSDHDVVFRVYHFKTDGFINVIKHLVDC